MLDGKARLTALIGQQTADLVVFSIILVFVSGSVLINAIRLVCGQLQQPNDQDPPQP